MDAAITWQEIESRLDELPQEDWPTLVDFLDFLLFRRKKAQTPPHLAESRPPYRVRVKLGGLWEGQPISDEDIAAARQEMWAGFGEFEP